MYVCMYVCNASDTTVEKWCAYPSEINNKIENAHIAKEESVTFVMNGADYTVDLTSSPPEQIREATNKRREMRRNIKTTPQAKPPQEHLIGLLYLILLQVVHRAGLFRFLKVLLYAVKLMNSIRQVLSM
mmetsp:Transcript_10257/g.15524  ORF Transcript_10257/g.15524 Transcript_10257/m.15524 type:complete len:129 (+) Transcript_10257:719-1105(+)